MPVCFSAALYSLTIFISSTMKSIFFACLLAVALARPDRSYDAPASQHRQDQIEIVRDDRHPPEDGKYSFDFETENGIRVSESGSRLDIDGNPTGQQGSISFTLDNGEPFELKFVANEHGFQPESSHIPVAPEFPHEIPQFVLEQIEKAAREDAEKVRSGSKLSYDD